MYATIGASWLKVYSSRVMDSLVEQMLAKM